MQAMSATLGSVGTGIRIAASAPAGTAFGESAGGADIGTLIASPLAKGLFQRAIIQSGGYQLNSRQTLRDEEAVGALEKLAWHDDATVSGAALRALGRVANAEAVRVVKASLASGSEDAASACLLAAERQRAQGHTDVAIALYDAVRAADVPRAARLGAMHGAIVTRNYFLMFSAVFCCARR